MKTSARITAQARWTAQELIDATALRLSTMQTFTTTGNTQACNDIRPSPKRELRGRYLVKLTPLILFRVQN
jgi:hypothetical protein